MKDEPDSSTRISISRLSVDERYSVKILGGRFERAILASIE